MADASLRVILSADGKQLAATMAKAEKDVQGLETQLKTLPASFARVDNSVSKTSRQLTAAGNAVKKTKFNFLEMGRVIQDLPFGFAGISNNLTQLIPGVGVLGLAFSGLVSAITFSQMGLRGWGVSSDSAGESAKKNAKDIETLEDRQKRLKEAFDEAAKSMVSQATKADLLGKALIDTTNKTAILTEATVKQGLAQVLFTQKEGLAQKILSDALQNRLKVEKTLFEFRQNEFKVAKKISELKPLRIATEAELKASGRFLNETEQQLFDLNKLANDLGLSFDKFVNDPKSGGETDKFFDNLIKRVHVFEKAINDRGIRIAKFEVIPDELKSDTIKRAQEFIQNAINRRFEFPVNPKLIIEAPVVSHGASYFASLSKEAGKLLQDLQREITKLTSRNPILIQAQRVQAEEKARGAEFATALGLNIEGVNQPVSLLTDLERQAANAAKTINGLLTPAFDGLFNAIKSGENPLKAFFQSLGQAVQNLIQQLLQAAIQAAVLSAISGGTFSFGKSFKSILGFRAEGGPVFSGKPYVVGERGPELFIPQGGGRIIPNNEMNSGIAGVTPGSLNITGQIVADGKNLRLIFARQGRYNDRNV